MNLRFPRISLLCSILASAALAAEPTIEFSGVIDPAAGDIVILLTDKTTGETRRVPLGGEYQGFAVASYDSAASTVVLAKEGVRTTLLLKGSRVQPQAPVSPAERMADMTRAAQQALMDKIRGLEGEALFNAFLAEAREGRLPRSETAEILGAQATIEADRVTAAQIPAKSARDRAEYDEFMRLNRASLPATDIDLKDLAFQRSQMTDVARTRAIEAKRQSIWTDFSGRLKATLAAALTKPEAAPAAAR